MTQRDTRWFVELLDDESPLKNFIVRNAISSAPRRVERDGDVREYWLCEQEVVNLLYVTYGGTVSSSLFRVHVQVRGEDGRWSEDYQTIPSPAVESRIGRGFIL